MKNTLLLVALGIVLTSVVLITVVNLPTAQNIQILATYPASKLKVQASIQGDTVRVSGAKRDELQACIAAVTKAITDFPIKYGNFRD